MITHHKYTEVPCEGPGVRNWSLSGSHAALCRFDPSFFVCRVVSSAPQPSPRGNDGHPQPPPSCFVVPFSEQPRWNYILSPSSGFPQGSTWSVCSGSAPQPATVRGQAVSSSLSRSAFQLHEGAGVTRKTGDRLLLFPYLLAPTQATSGRWLIVDFVDLGDAEL